MGEKALRDCNTRLRLGLAHLASYCKFTSGPKIAVSSPLVHSILVFKRLRFPLYPFRIHWPNTLTSHIARKNTITEANPTPIVPRLLFAHPSISVSRFADSRAARSQVPDSPFSRVAGCIRWDLYAGRGGNTSKFWRAPGLIYRGAAFCRAAGFFECFRNKPGTSYEVPEKISRRACVYCARKKFIRAFQVRMRGMRMVLAGLRVEWLFVLKNRNINQMTWKCKTTMRGVWILIKVCWN